MELCARQTVVLPLLKYGCMFCMDIMRRRSKQVHYYRGVSISFFSSPSFLPYIHVFLYPTTLKKSVVFYATMYNLISKSCICLDSHQVHNEAMYAVRPCLVRLGNIRLVLWS